MGLVQVSYLAGKSAVGPLSATSALHMLWHESSKPMKHTMKHSSFFAFFAMFFLISSHFRQKWPEQLFSDTTVFIVVCVLVSIVGTGLALSSCNADM